MRPIAPVAEPGMSALFANNNRNKKSVQLDLKSAAGKAALRKLIATGDVLVHNMRQEALDKLGFSYDAVHAMNPRLVYCAGVGYGRAGPYAGRPAYDDVIQAASGFAGLFELRDGTPQYAPSIVADKVSGLHLVYAVLAALLHRERTGTNPGYVEIPMFEAMVAFNLSEHLSAATWGGTGGAGYQRSVSPDRRPFRTKDGWLGVLPYTPLHWAKLLPELGRADVAETAWFKDPTERSRNFSKLYAVLSEGLPQRTTAEWVEMLQRLDVPHAVVASPNDLLTDPHLTAVDFFSPNFSGDSPVVRALRQPVGFADLAITPDLPPPRLGADTDAVLRAAGCTEAEIKAAMVVKG